MDLLIEKYKKYEPFFGGWYIKSLLGEGGYGAVFEVEKVEFDTTYKAALKIVSIPQSESELKSILSEGLDEASTATYYEDILHKMMDEINLMVKMKGHSNIVSCEDHQVIPHDGSIGWDIIIRMELLTPIVDYQKTHPFTERDVIELGIDICEALEVCKRYKIIHRDIKPENIFVSRTDNYKLGDFGIARTMENTKGASTKAGTGRYMAPEVYRGERYNDTVDLYSLGLVLYRYLNENRLPFFPPYPQPIRYSDQETAQEKRLSGEILSKAIHASEEMTQIINKACAFNPGDRYQTAADMKNDLIRLKKIMDIKNEFNEEKIEKSAEGELFESDCNALDDEEVDETVGIFFVTSMEHRDDEPLDKTEVISNANKELQSKMNIEDEEKTLGIFSGVPQKIATNELDHIKKDKQRNKTSNVKIFVMAILVLVALGVCGYSFKEYFITANISDTNINQEILIGEVSNNEISESINEVDVVGIVSQTEEPEIQVGDIIVFGSYEQDNNLDNGPEPIEWYVTNKNDEILTLASVYILDVMPYNDKKESYITWEKCSLRSWLNEDFYNRAFVENEKNMICNSFVTTIDEGNRQVGKDTWDNVYLFSYRELGIYKKTYLTDYAVARGAYENDEGAGNWWIRNTVNNGCAVVDDGQRVSIYQSITNSTIGVRPIIRIDYLAMQKQEDIFHLN